jgi:hypothetical protein
MSTARRIVAESERADRAVDSFSGQPERGSALAAIRPRHLATSRHMVIATCFAHASPTGGTPPGVPPCADLVQIGPGCRPRSPRPVASPRDPREAGSSPASRRYPCGNEGSMPTSRRRPPFPRRMTRAQRARSRSVSARSSASLIHSPARQRTTISARRRAPSALSPVARMTATISSTVRGSAGKRRPLFFWRAASVVAGHGHRRTLVAGCVEQPFG